MRASVLSGVCLAIGTAWLGSAAVAQDRSAAAPAADARQTEPVDLTRLHAQVILDRLGFSSGVNDGRESAAFRDALRGFQEVRGLPRSGTLDPATLRALHPYREIRPVIAVVIGAGDAAGPFRPIPDSLAEQEDMDRMGYESLMERLAERFHTTPETLVRLNTPRTRIGAGQRIVVPGVLPGSRDYEIDNDEFRDTLSKLNVDARQPRAERVVVSKSTGLLRAYDGDGRLLAQFPATMGSRHDPLPLGNWTIQGVAYNPDWRMNPAILRTVSNSEPVRIIPPGPNNPVGVVWIDLDKEHYGIHGTAEPQNIGQTESNGCVRLTNWDAARLALMVRPGVSARFVA